MRHGACRAAIIWDTAKLCVSAKETLKSSFNAFVKLEGFKRILSFDAIEAAETQKLINASAAEKKSMNHDRQLCMFFVDAGPCGGGNHWSF